MKCISCNKKITGESKIIWWGCDGDPLCSKTCEDNYRKDMDILNSIPLSDTKSFENWMKL